MQMPFVLEQLGSQYHQNGLVGDLTHLVAVFGSQQKALVRCIKDKVLLFDARMVRDKATSFQTNDRLLHTAVAIIFEMIAAIDVEDTLDLERDHALDHGQATAGVREGFQIN